MWQMPQASTQGWGGMLWLSAGGYGELGICPQVKITHIHTYIYITEGGAPVITLP